MIRPLAEYSRTGAVTIWLALLSFSAFSSTGLAQDLDRRNHAALTQGLAIGAPQSGILTIQPDRMFAESAFGKRVTREIEAEGAVLTAENRRIEAELRAEEQALTQRRATTDPETFRTLADAFDAKVQGTRLQQDEKLHNINVMGETARREFLAASLPVLEQIMRESGAAAIMDQTSVFLSSDVVDITDLAITRVDKVLGDGLPGGDSSQEPSD